MIDTPRVNGEKPLNLVIVRGSVAGLLYGNMFKRLGHNVHPLEQTTSLTRAGQAAGIGLGPRGLDFLKMYRCKEPNAFTCTGF